MYSDTQLCISSIFSALFDACRIVYSASWDTSEFGCADGMCFEDFQDAEVLHRYKAQRMARIAESRLDRLLW